MSKFLPKEEMTEELWTAVALKNVVKGKPLPRAKMVPTPSGAGVLVDSASKARDAFAAFAAHVLAKIPSALVVPIPSSTDLDLHVSSRTLPLAEAAAGARLRVVDRLRFREALGAAHEGGGSRSVSVLRNALSFAAELSAGQTVVLVDDVLTSGAHMQASADVLRAAGAGRVIGLCVAEAVQDLPDRVWFPNPRELFFDGEDPFGW